jgi:hypothetical protein
LIREFLEFYRLDYTLAIYGPETNCTEKTKRSSLAERAGLDSNSKAPLLVQLLENFMSGGSKVRAPSPPKSAPIAPL